MGAAGESMPMFNFPCAFWTSILRYGERTIHSA